MDKRHAELLKLLIDDLNSKSNDEIFNELVEAGIEFDDISDSQTIIGSNKKVKLTGSTNCDYDIKNPELLCA